VGGISTRWVLAAAFILGVVLVGVDHAYEPTLDFGIIHELGVALIVAAIIGFAIDVTLTKAVARDVFKATLGHILRDEFRAEVTRITGYKFLCERHVLVVEIKLLPDHVVEVTTSIERHITNITAYPEKYRAYLYIDEWGFPIGVSQILECYLLIDGKKISGKSLKAEPFRLKWSSADVDIAPRKTFTSFSKYQEFRRDNDTISVFLATPTLNPEIEVRLPDELDCSIGFGASETSIVKYEYANRSRLNGTYFPHQAMSVRWWPKVTT
jgi:hypothetical protein